MSDKKYVVFDFEGVVFNTRLREMYVDIFKENGRDLSELDYFFENVFEERYRSENCRQTTVSRMTDHLISKYPEWEHELKAFNAEEQFDKYVAGVIDGMGELIEYFSSSDEYELYGLTNWPGDAFEVLRKQYPEIVAKFKSVIVSGQNGCKKPDFEIWMIANEVMGSPDPSRVHFFDDKQRNVDTAINEVDWNAHYFEAANSVYEVFPEIKI